MYEVEKDLLEGAVGGPYPGEVFRYLGGDSYPVFLGLVSQDEEHPLYHLRELVAGPF